MRSLRDCDLNHNLLIVYCLLFIVYCNKRESERKPGSVLSIVADGEGSYLSGTFVTKRLKRYTKCGTGKRPTVVPTTLHPTGVYRTSTSRYCWCALTAPLHPYLITDSLHHRRYFSVALSSRSLALGVTQQVWSFGSPDFPQTDRNANLQPPRLLSPLSSLS